MPVIAEAMVEAGIEEREHRRGRRDLGPGLIGALLVGVSAAKALALAWDVPFVGGEPPRGATCTRASSRSPTSSCRCVVLLVSGGHTMLVALEAHGDVPGARADGRRRGRRGVRQGGALPGARLPGRPGDRPAVGRGRPDGDPLPAGDARRRPRLLVLGAEDVGGEPRAQAPRGAHGRRGGVVPGGGGRRAGRQGAAGGRARSARRASAWAGAWRPTRCCASGSRRRAPRTGCGRSCRAVPCAPTTPR